MNAAVLVAAACHHKKSQSQRANVLSLPQAPATPAFAAVCVHKLSQLFCAQKRHFVWKNLSETV